MTSRRGGKSSGFVYTILLVFLYYFLSSTGTQLGRQNKLPAFFAVWSANLLFASVGIFLLWQMATGGSILSAIAAWAARAPKPAANGSIRHGISLTGLLDKLQPRPQRAKSRNAFPRILDEYVVREFLNTFLLVLSGFVLLMLVFTFFDLVGDILRNHIPLTTVGAYLVNLTPEHALPDRAAGGADRRPGHVRRAQSQQRNRRHEGHRHQPLSTGRSCRLHRRHTGDQPVSFRPVLSAPGQSPAGSAAQHHQRPAAADRYCTPNSTGSSGSRAQASPAVSSTTSSTILTIGVR